MDIRRMRSIEIDERNMLAIVKAMKRGLTLNIHGGGGPTGWEFFTHFDAYEKATIKGRADFFNDTQRWMNEKKLGVDMGHWNQDLRRQDGYGFTQEEHEMVNPKHLCGSYYRTLTPSKIGA
jgi:hypothetical protein